MYDCFFPVLQGSGESAVAVLTGETEDISCGLILSSIGYRSVPISPGVPFLPKQGIIPNSMGRVQGAPGQCPPPFNYETLAIAVLAIYIDIIGRTVLQWLGKKRSHRSHRNYNDGQF